MFLPIHPDDLLFFNEVADVMRKVAKGYDLPLMAIEAYPMPTRGMADRLGDCAHDGVIRLVMRATVDGKFVDDPRTPDDVWRTAAHELAHLRHMNHGLAFQTFELEMRQAVANARPDHKQRVIDKLVKMQASRDGEAQLGNTEAAEAFAAMINKMLIENELNPSDLDYARATDSDPVVEMTTNLEKYRIEKKKSRVAWQERLARVVAEAHLCRFLIRTGTNNITFVGTRSHATVAEYAYGTLVPAATKMCADAYHEYGMECGRKAGLNKWIAGEPGFNESWLYAFVGRIDERFHEARKAAVKQAAVDVPGGSSQALMRLEGALVKAQRYVDDKFKGSASSLKRTSANHSEGRRAGRAAADAMTIGRRGIDGGPRKMLKS